MRMPHTPFPKTVRLTLPLFCIGLALAPVRGDYITDEIDRQWDELALEIEDAEVELVMGCNMFKRNTYITHINPYLREKNDIYDRQALILESDRDPLDIVLRRTRALCDHLKAGVDLGALDGELSSLETRAAGIAPSSASQRKDLYHEVCAVRRRIALSNPLLDFDKVLVGGGMVGAYHLSAIAWASYGNFRNWIKVVENPFSDNPTSYNMLENSEFTNGPLQGRRIMDFDGSFDHPCLSYDGQTVYFAWVERDTSGRKMFEGSYSEKASHAQAAWGKGVSEKYVYHIYKVNIDGTNLTQLTFGVYNDAHPWELPNGRIVFVSTRRAGFDRCVDNKSNLLYSIKPDGSDMIQLSWHETHEWYPSVDNNGMIMYTRWDYIDRGADVAHHLWTCYPDGSDPRAPHANYPHPWIKEKLTEAYEYFDYEVPNLYGYGQGVNIRSYIEFLYRPIPDSRKLICVSGLHHGDAIGNLMIVDPDVEDDGIMSQAKRITPYLHPEGEGDGKVPGERRPKYCTPWPLSEDFYLTSWNKTLVLLDRFGNREPLYSDDQRPNFPTPLRPRKRPPVLATRTHQGEEADPNHDRATISVQDVYNTHPFWFPPEVVQQRAIKWLRIVQLYPRVRIFDDNGDRIPVAHTPRAPCRMSLGVVPVEEDGSVYCQAPVEKGIYFQALDENYMALHSMRSLTYVHPGEQLSCVGCHESKWESPPARNETPLAMQRPPSKIAPEFEGGPEPMNYHRLVKPIFDNTCIPCHTEKGARGIKSSDYESFRWNSFWYEQAFGPMPASGSMTAPGFCGASYTKIGKALVKSHKDRLTEDQWNKVVMWLDLNTMQYGSGYDIEKQKAGELVWPMVDVDPENPVGVEIDQPVPDEVPSAVSASPAPASATLPRIRVRAGTDRLHVSGIGAGPLSVVVYDMSGRVVLRGARAGAEGIDVRALGNGTFMVRVKTPQHTLSQEIVLAQ